MTKTRLACTAAVAFVLSAGMAGQAWAKKPVVGIAEMQTVAQNISCRGWSAAAGRDCNHHLTEGFRIMLETAIVKSNKMDVMERKQGGIVIQEQGLGQMGLTTSGGKVGGLTGIDYLIYGSITKFGARKTGFAVSGGLLSSATKGLLGGGAGTASVHTVMAVDLKITDVATGQIILADTVEGEAKTGEAMSFGGFSTSAQQGDPFADVQRLLAARLAEAIVTVHIPFKVIKVMGDGSLIVNYGNAFFRPGDKLAMFEVGEEIVDPDTGEVLGADTTETGMVEITAAEPRFSRARALEGNPTAGSVLRRVVEQSQQTTKRKRSGGTLFPSDQMGQ